MATTNKRKILPTEGYSESAVQENTDDTLPFALVELAKDLQLGTAKHKNFVFSPISIQLSMSLMANGATGSTLNELLTFSQVESLDHLNSVASKLLAALTSSPQPLGPKLTHVGGAWLHHSFSLNPNFITCAQDIYKVKAETVDFRNEMKAEEVVSRVNKWAKDATDGLINTILPKLDPDTTLVLANALYFKGIWNILFRKSLTKNSDFYLHDGETVQVPFMSSTRAQYIQTFQDFKVLRLPYKKDTSVRGVALSMYIILPHEKNGLWTIVGRMGSDPCFLEKHTPVITMDVKVGTFMVPKFKMTYEFEASEFLKGVGVKSCFSVNAEFDDMLLDPKLGGPVCISQIHHKSYIEINEQGTEAAAVTVSQLRRCIGKVRPPIPPVDFVADHPFMFMIRDDETGMVLFIGHVINPTLL